MFTVCVQRRDRRQLCGLGKIRHREFAMASSEMSEAEFTKVLQTVFGHLAENTVDGSIHDVCMELL